ncbi:MAG TPA: hypothetical protein ENJ37_03375 [Deltaproteobacteria bacterium]|nr:hypothetical protein [Deltaproteobacteria bacterium]
MGLRLFIATYVVVIYLTLPLMEPLLRRAEVLAGRDGVALGVDAALLVCAVLAALAVARTAGILRAAAFAAAAAAVLGAAWFALDLPQERVHFIEYGLLGLLALKAAGRGLGAAVAAFIFVTFVGATDEFIQHLLPMRVGDLRDVFINAVAGGMGLWAGLLLFRR